MGLKKPEDADHFIFQMPDGAPNVVFNGLWGNGQLFCDLFVREFIKAAEFENFFSDRRKIFDKCFHLFKILFMICGACIPDSCDIVYRVEKITIGSSFLSEEIDHGTACNTEKLYGDIILQRKIFPVLPHLDESELYCFFREISGVTMPEHIIIQFGMVLLVYLFKALDVAALYLLNHLHSRLQIS